MAVNCWVLPTATEAVEGVTLIDCRTAPPVPLSVAVCGLVTAPSDTLNCPVRSPAAVGTNVTVTEQDAPAGSVAGGMGQLLVSLKSPVVWIEVMERATGCSLVTSTVLLSLVAPIFSNPKSTEVGKTATGLTPVPLKLAIVGDP